METATAGDAPHGPVRMLVSTTHVLARAAVRRARARLARRATPELAKFNLDAVGATVVLSKAWASAGAAKSEDGGVASPFRKSRAISEQRSWDVFDTLLARRCGEPWRVFDNVEATVCEVGFAADRRECEAAAVEESPVNVWERLYDKLAIKRGWSAHKRAEVMRAELAEEFQQAIPIQCNINEVRDGDVLLSDMYLPAEEILSLLCSKCGLRADVSVFVSYSGKRNGAAWRWLTIAAATASAIIVSHTGDSIAADLEGPANHHGPIGNLCKLSARTCIEEALAAHGDRPLADYVRAVRLACPKRDWLPMWSEAANANISAMAIASRHLRDMLADADAWQTAHALREGIERPFGALLFATRDCLHIASLFKAMFSDLAPRVKLFVTSRALSVAAEPLYVQYAAAELARSSMLVDCQGSGRSFDKFMDTHLLSPAGPLILSSEEDLSRMRTRFIAPWMNSLPKERTIGFQTMLEEWNAVASGTILSIAPDGMPVLARETSDAYMELGEVCVEVTAAALRLGPPPLPCGTVESWNRVVLPLLPSPTACSSRHVGEHKPEVPGFHEDDTLVGLLHATRRLGLTIPPLVRGLPFPHGPAIIRAADKLRCARGSLASPRHAFAEIYHALWRQLCVSAAPVRVCERRLVRCTGAACTDGSMDGLREPLSPFWSTCFFAGSVTIDDVGPDLRPIGGRSASSLKPSPAKLPASAAPYNIVILSGSDAWAWGCSVDDDDRAEHESSPSGEFFDASSWASAISDSWSMVSEGGWLVVEGLREVMPHSPTASMIKTAMRRVWLSQPAGSPFETDTPFPSMAWMKAWDSQSPQWIANGHATDALWIVRKRGKLVCDKRVAVTG